MRPYLAALVLLLIACGGGATTSPATVTRPANPVIVPGECAIRCENLRPQLERDFGATSVNCGTPEILGALSNDECNCIFERRFGVRLNGGFAEPLSSKTRCPP